MESETEKPSLVSIFQRNSIPAQFASVYAKIFQDNDIDETIHEQLTPRLVGKVGDQ